ncbi:uncharacterized protein LOC128890152 isoform X3 [Hylaeus anthracinus]|uniref:uncharacterized protein LOC128890152 isoform X3 n=1 Tax=Hylaeus anthracinus TaxID=313031 RepID=UPI0023B90B40|nr:uncharacterized protein LOC128890152 isoform X3 [Hylaeus anthracinus]XP_054004373.1 uncharacterized protein LOC128890152 isoform X3 [Hylaeus anthracinus]XP_054004374.1 uncharacterized protein LOC128890152 isoform X3 [Hylaeus anthracinus]
MSLETLLEAAWFVEEQEKRRERLASSSSSSSDHPLVVAPHSNNHNSNEPRGAKLKRERTEQDDLFCEEKMLIIDGSFYFAEEEPLENNRTNGNHSAGSRGSPVISSTRVTPPTASANPGHLTALHSTSHHHLPPHQQQQQQQQQAPQQQQQPHHHHHHHNNHNSTHNPYVENHNSNHSQQNTGNLVVDVEPSHDSKKHRNGPCVIRSGTREVHNKLEKNRRAHLKECFELLKRQLPSQDEKKSSNLSILHAAIRHIQTLRRKERDYEHEMERLAREKIAAQQKLLALKKELAATWDHIDFNTLLPEQNSAADAIATKSESMEVDVTGLARGGTRYSSTSSLSSAATASSPQTLQTTSTTSNIHNQVATAAVVCQTQGLNLAQSSRESPPASSSPGMPTPSIPTPAQEKVNTSPSGMVPQQHQLHLPISAQMLNTNQGLATIVPTLQHIGSSLRVIPGDTRQLLVTHTAGNTESRPLTLAVQNSSDQSRPLIAVQSNTGSEPRPVALVVHSSTANDNRVTFVHSNLSNNDRPLALAVQQSSASDVRPVTFVHSANEGRPIVLAAHSPALNVSNAQTRIRAGDTQTTHKMVGGVALVGGNASELTRLPGGAELNILPANGLTLSHASVSLQTATGKPGSTVMQNAPSTEGIAHIVGPHTPLSGLTPIVTPMTVVSQGNQVTAHILAPSSLAGKMITTPILKSVAQMPIVNAQYINTTTLVKPVVVVSSPSTSTAQSTTASSTQPSSTTHTTV